MIYPANEETITLAAKAIQAGEVVAFPTETVYGLGANAFNSEAVATIFEIKQRPFFDPLIVHVNSIQMVEQIVSRLPEIALQSIKNFWPGPLTIVLPKKNIIPDIVTAGLDTVAVRMPAHSVAQQLIEKAGVPIAAPSANPFGYLSPTTAYHVEKQLGDKVNIILDGGQSPVGVESTIIKVENDTVTVLRYGGIPVEDLKSIAGKVSVSESLKVESPGQLPYHYAPKTKIVLIKDYEDIPDDSDCGLMLFKKKNLPYKNLKIVYLSENGDLRQAAANLFPCLHALDAMSLKVIYAENVPEVGLGKAIMDRLQKAQARHI